ncbi:MAG: S8 family serine peptidase [Catenulispora sp.]|nr:S8 family serine peptidase [Catenulispora sp.]
MSARTALAAGVAAAALISVTQSPVSFAAPASSRHQTPTPQQSPPPHHLAMRTNHVSYAEAAENENSDQDPRTNPGTNYQAPKLCSSYYGQRPAKKVPDAFGGRNPDAVCGYTPEQLRYADGVTQSRESGAGVTVAIVDAYASPTMLADANRYAMNHGERLLAPPQFREVTPPTYRHTTDGVCETPSSWAEEEALDVEAVHAMAPQADIVYVAAASCDDTDLLAALQKVVDQHLASIVTNSWGGVPHSVYGDEDPATTAAFSALFQRGGQQGISFLFASGDCGAADPSTECATDSARPQTEYPAQDPWVTAVGGTSLAIGPFGAYGGEVGWGDRRSVLAPGGKAWAPAAGAGQWRFGGGGGTSEDVPQPTYQAGVVPDALSTKLMTAAKTAAHPMRVVPDVALAADPMTGFLIGVTAKQPNGRTEYGEGQIGGTSLASPLFAGLLADAEQGVGHPFGFLNPALYAKAASGAFNDVTPTSFPATDLDATDLDTTDLDAPKPPATVVDLGRDSAGVRQARLYQLGDDGLLRTGVGFDTVTGLGSPSLSFLRSWR